MAESQLLLGMFTLNDCRVCATKSIYVTSLVPLQQKFVQLAFCIAQRSKQLEANNNEWPWNRGILLKLKTKLPHANVFCVLNNFYFYKMATNLNQTPFDLCHDSPAVLWRIVIHGEVIGPILVLSAMAAAIAFLRRLSSALSARLLRCWWARGCRGGGGRSSRLAYFHNHRLQLNIWRLIFNDWIAGFRSGVVNNKWRRLNDDRLRFNVNIRRLGSHNNRRLLVDVNRLLLLFARLRSTSLYHRLHLLLMWLRLRFSFLVISRIRVMRVSLWRFGWVFIVIISVVHLSVLVAFFFRDVVLFIHGIGVVVWAMATGVFMQMSTRAVIWRVVWVAIIVAFAVLASITPPFGVSHNAESRISVIVIVFQQQLSFLRCCYLQMKFIKSSKKWKLLDNSPPQQPPEEMRQILCSSWLNYTPERETDNICRKRFA